VKKQLGEVLLEAEKKFLRDHLSSLKLNVADLPMYLGPYRNSMNILMDKLCQERGYIFGVDLEVFYEKTYDYPSGTTEPYYELKKIVREGL